MRRSLSVFCLLTSAFWAAACSGPAGPGGPASGPSAPDEPARPAPPAYETFDPAGYDARPPVRPVTVEHDVPARLMEGRVEVPATPTTPTAPRPVTVEGFRIQVFSSDDRQAADRVRADATRWFESVQGNPGAPDRLDAEIAYIQPYYRVRLGAFAERAEADRALTLVRRRFAEAFVVPDVVTVYE